MCTVSELPDPPISCIGACTSKQAPGWTDAMDNEFGRTEQGGDFWDGVAAEDFNAITAK